MKKRIISILLSLVMLFALLPTAAFAKDLSDITFSGGTSAYIDKLEIDGYVITNCTNQMEGPGWRVDKYALYLSGYDGGGIIAEMKSGYSLNVIVSYDSKITSNTYGICTNSALTLQAPRENTKLEMDFSHYGIYCSGLLTIYQGKYILTGRGGNPMVAITQGHMMIEGFNLSEGATVIIDVSGRCNYDLYGIKGLGKVVGGTGGKIGKLLVSVVNTGTGNAYAHDMSTQLTDHLKNNADKFKNEPGLLVVNIPDCTVTVTSTSGGKVSGGGTYAAGKTVTLTATPDEGYIFKNWTNTHDGRGNGLGASITFIATEDIHYTAYFEQYSVTYPVTVRSAGNGTVNGGGNYRKGETVTITATPDVGYAFDYWTDGYGTKVSGAGATYSFPVTGHSTFTAWFKEVTYGVVVSSAGNGTVSGGGTYKQGETATITATPDTGYVFDYWTDRYKNVVSGAGATYSFTVGRNRAYTAHFKKGTANTITAANVTIPAPAAGQKATTYKSWTTDVPEKYTVSGGTWTKGTDANGAEMGENETFAAGQKYTAVFVVATKSGYTLADNFAATVNGNPAVKESPANLHLWYYTFTCSASGAITAADVTIPAPAAGQKVSAHKDLTSDAPEKYTVTGTWIKGADPDGSAMDQNETFEAGQKYTIVFVVATKPGYTLADSFTAKANGNSAVRYNSTSLSLWYYTFTCPASGAITAAKVTIPTPAAGQKATTYKSWTTDVPEKYTVSGGTWTKGTDINGAEMGENETFVAGQKYTAVFVVATKSGYSLADNFAATVNGNPAVKESPANLHLWYYTFTCPAAGAPVITVQPTAVNVKAGESASFKVTATGENLSYQWYSVSGGAATALSKTDTCTVSNVQQGQSGTFYYCVVSNAAGSVSSEQVKLNVFSTDAACPFVDVPTTAYYYDAVQWAYGSGVTGGIDATHFKPGDGVSRAQVVSFLWRAAGSPVVDHAMSFSDVPAGKYYTEAVRWAVANGITGGTDATHFNPNGKCNRAQIVTFLYRYSKASPVSSANPFTDVKAGAYYNDAVLWAVANGVTGGTSATTFAPTNGCTRGQVVTFLYRWMVK